ncbi:B3/4 domain protein [Anaerotignum neopropionicum]|uniref:B3/4 domain protein n=1 Tax=Anaerotignum neopropionicum TaxID=36847 RepID=A0A136WG39_9FIRM|nr:phenylalanine--tRNA ligase beta subunit-related protein [Anaerotignum neopropionicum]KXL53474.1 B3/4 domain protein [Anaerotignum neopropionicum]
MIKLHPNMNDSQRTVFGVLILKDIAVTKEGKQAFKTLVLQELDDINKTHLNYERKTFSQTNEVIKPYIRYYKKFKKTYHVLPQLESILNGKAFPETTPLIQALFLTELKTALLIAGHDLKKCRLPLTIQKSQGGETYMGSGNRSVVLKPNDICLKDNESFILSIIYGQDENTRITENTTDVLFLIDGVPGLGEKYVEDGLKTLLSYVRVFAPTSSLSELKILDTASLERRDNC